jgi:acetyltransferase EpsM
MTSLEPTPVAPTRLVILGGPGSGTIVADAIAARIEAGARLALLGFLNDTLPRDALIAGAPVLGDFASWREQPADVCFISAIPRAKEAFARLERLRALGIPDERWSTLVHPRAVVSRSASLGPGSYVGPNAVVEAGVRGGAHAILRGGAYVSHDVTLGDFVFIGPNATVLGRSHIGDGAFLAANTVCRDGVSIGRYAVVGIGAVVHGDVGDHLVVIGQPARPVSRLLP